MNDNSCNPCIVVLVIHHSSCEHMFSVPRSYEMTCNPRAGPQIRAWRVNVCLEVFVRYLFHPLVFSRGKIDNLLLWKCCGHWNFFLQAPLTRGTHVSKIEYSERIRYSGVVRLGLQTSYSIRNLFPACRSNIGSILTRNNFTIAFFLSLSCGFLNRVCHIYLS